MAAHKDLTAFTIAHSITLALATLGFVNVPSPPVEAVIALSIAFVAVEIVHVRQGRRSLAARAPWLVAFVFGLLHGFGFAGALNEIGLPGGTNSGGAAVLQHRSGDRTASFRRSGCLHCSGSSGQQTVAAHMAEACAAIRHRHDRDVLGDRTCRRVLKHCTIGENKGMKTNMSQVEVNLLCRVALAGLLSAAFPFRPGDRQTPLRMWAPSTRRRLTKSFRPNVLIRLGLVAISQPGRCSATRTSTPRFPWMPEPSAPGSDRAMPIVLPKARKLLRPPANWRSCPARSTSLSLQIIPTIWASSPTFLPEIPNSRRSSRSSVVRHDRSRARAQTRPLRSSRHFGAGQVPRARFSIHPATPLIVPRGRKPLMPRKRQTIRAASLHSLVMSGPRIPEATICIAMSSSVTTPTRHAGRSLYDTAAGER